MALFSKVNRPLLSRRHLLKAGVLGGAALALYSSEIERHWIDVTHRDIALRNLPAAFHGMRIAQVSDIHMDEYTEPFFLRDVVRKVNELKPDMVLLTGDFVSEGPRSKRFAKTAAQECAETLQSLDCRERYGVLGNHDVTVSRKGVLQAMAGNGVRMLVNTALPLERAGEHGTERIWLAGLDDPLAGRPLPDVAMAELMAGASRKAIDEPVVMMCHCPDYADRMLATPAGQAVDLMLSGHTHGGQVRLPLIGALHLPPMGEKYVEGLFQLGSMQLYVNRGVGTVGVPLRLDCPPEISVLTLRRA